MEARTPAQLPEVTDRQVEVAKLIADGLDNPAIAERLGISLAGAKYHVSELLARLNLTSRDEIGDWYRGRSSGSLLRRFALAPLGWALAGAGGVAASGLAAVAIVLGQGGGGVEVAPVVVPTPQVAVGNGAFVAVDATPVERRSRFTSTLLDDGQVLVAGGQVRGPGGAAELYDPATEAFSLTGAMVETRRSHAAVRLADGRVLLIGGIAVNVKTQSSEILDSAEVYDPDTGQFDTASSMTRPRWDEAAVTLGDGRVLVSGGVVENSDDGGEITPTAEIYDPETNRFTSTGEMSFARRSHRLTLLDDGRVLVTGGGPLEVYDAATGEFSLFGGEPVFGDSFAVATLLADGRVLITGVRDAAKGQSPGGSTTAAYIVDPRSGAVTRTGDLTSARDQYHTATLLPDGRVLLSGGAGGWAASDSAPPEYPPAEIFDPITETFEAISSTASFIVPGGLRATNVMTHVAGHTSTALPDGSVLMIGLSPGFGEMGAERFELIDSDGDDRFGEFVSTLPATPALEPGDVLASDATFLVSTVGAPLGFEPFWRAVSERGLQLREAPTADLGMCSSVRGGGAVALRGEPLDGSNAEDFFLYIYPSAESLAEHWIIGTDSRTVPRPGTSCEQAIGQTIELLSTRVQVLVNQNQLVIFNFLRQPGIDERDDTTRALLIEAF